MSALPKANFALQDLLLQVASKSNMHLKYACAIIYRNKVIATGFNTYETQRIFCGHSCLL